MHNIGTIEVLGRQFELKLDSLDRFCAEVDGHTFSGNTRAHLMLILTKHLKVKRKKLEMWCFEITGGEVLPVLVTGIHAGNGNILYREWNKDFDGWGPTQQTYSSQDLFQALTEPDNERLEQNLKIIVDAEAVVGSLCQPISKTELERELGIT